MLGWGAGLGVKDILEKRTFTNVIFDIRISQIHVQKIRNQNVHFGCIVPCPSWAVSTIYLGVGYLELLILDKAMREPSSGIGEVEHPTSLRLTFNLLNLGCYRQSNVYG